MTYDPVTHTLTGEADPAKVGAAAYVVRVQYGPAKNPAETTRTIRPDFRPSTGPIRIRCNVLNLMSWVRHRPLCFRLARVVEYASSPPISRVVDSTEGGEFPLPLERLDFGGELVAWRPNDLSFTPSTDRSARGKAYVVSVGYKGRSDLSIRREFAADFAALDGPEPADVQSIQFSIEGVAAGATQFTPGTKARFDVSVTDKGGRRYSLRGDALRVPMSRLRVAAENLAIDADTATVEASPDAKKMLNKQYSFSVSYVGRDDISSTRMYEPDFLAMLQQFVFRADAITLQGAAGEPGEPGEFGDSGRGGSPAPAADKVRPRRRRRSRRCRTRGTRRPARRSRTPRQDCRHACHDRRWWNEAGGLRTDRTGKEPAYYVRQLDSKPIRVQSWAELAVPVAPAALAGLVEKAVRDIPPGTVARVDQAGPAAQAVKVARAEISN